MKHVLVSLLLVAGCSSTDATANTGDGGCPSGQLLASFYDRPGCGVARVTACVNEIDDACGSTYCGCSGVTIHGPCGVRAPEPYLYEGECRPDAGADATVDAASDSSSDAPGD